MAADGGYELHGRLFKGSLEHPERDESRGCSVVDLAAARSLAATWCRAGFTVWIYDHGHRSPFPHASDLRVIEVLRPPTDGGARP